MSGMQTVILIVVAGLFLAALARTLASKKVSAPEGRYTLQGPLCTHAELQFLDTLRTVLAPSHCVMVKVRLLDVLKPSSPAAMRRVSQKHVDFVVCDARTTMPLYIIELNDKSHARPDRAARDQFVERALLGAGIPILWQRAQSQYEPRELQAAIAKMTSASQPVRPRTFRQIS